MQPISTFESSVAKFIEQLPGCGSDIIAQQFAEHKRDTVIKALETLMNGGHIVSDNRGRDGQTVYYTWKKVGV